jgi:inhibitor of cysteine peptidase
MLITGIVRFSSVIAISLLLGGCDISSTIRLDSSANGRQVSLARAQLLEVALPTNPSTGYRWDVAEVDTAIVQQQGASTYAPEAGPQPLVGAGGTETFRFKAIGAGRTTLKLIYHRPWETNVDPAQTFALQLVVG